MRVLAERGRRRLVLWSRRTLRTEAATREVGSYYTAGEDGELERVTVWDWTPAGPLEVPLFNPSLDDVAAAVDWVGM